MRRAAALTLTALTTLGAMAAGLAPASAEDAAASDPTGDVAVFSSRDAGLYTAHVDIEGTSVDHRADTVVMTVDLLDVTKDLTSEVQGAIQTPRALFYARVQYGPEGKSVFLQRDGDGGEIWCDGLGAAVRPAADRVVLTVPRSCLGNPGAVRFGSRAIAGDGPRTLVDDGRRKQAVRSPEQPIKIGPREVARG